MDIWDFALMVPQIKAVLMPVATTLITTSTVMTVIISAGRKIAKTIPGEADDEIVNRFEAKYNEFKSLPVVGLLFSIADRLSLAKDIKG